MPPNVREELYQNFSQRFGGLPAWIVRAPGRVNLIGEHTDYNDGFVFPLAINRHIWIAGRARTDSKVNIHTVEFDQTGTLVISDRMRRVKGWMIYPQGMAHALQNAGYRLTGWEGVVMSDLPRGAGLSSSAAIELAVARAFAASSGFQWEPPIMAHLAQKAENEWVGMACGIMDQLVCACGAAAQALLIDCRSLTTNPYPLPDGTSVVVMDTGVRRNLVGSPYNDRRRQCQEAAKAAGAAMLRDVSLEKLESLEGELSPLAFKRARHVISENIRTVQAAHAMKAGNVELLGSLMLESHASLRDDFEVSCPELDIMTAIASRQTGCLGARMTGAGFGGCAIALVEQDHLEPFMELVTTIYLEKTRIDPSLYPCQAVDGVSIEALI